MENIDQVIGLKLEVWWTRNYAVLKVRYFDEKENQKFWRDKLDSKPQVLPGQMALQELVLERQALETSIRSTIEWKQN